MIFLNLLACPSRSLLLVQLIFLASCSNSYENTEINSANLNQKIEECYHKMVYDYDNSLIDKIQLYLEGNTIEIKSPYHKALNKYVLGVQSFYGADYENSKKQLLEAKAIFGQLTGHEEKLALCYNDLGMVSRAQGDLNLCFNNSNMALNLYDKLEHFEGLAETHYKMALIYKQENYPWTKVREHAYKSLHLINIKHLVKSSMKKKLYIILSKAEIELGNFDKVDSLLSLIDHKSTLKDHRIRYYMHEAKGKLFIKMNDDKQASEHLLVASHHATEYIKELKKRSLVHNLSKLTFNKELHAQKKKVIANQYNLIVYACVIIVLILVCGIYYKRQSTRLRKKTDQLNKTNAQIKYVLQEKNSINHELKTSNKKIEDLLFYNNRTLYSKQLKLTLINEKIKTIAKTITALSYEGSMIDPSKLLSIEKLMHQIIREDEEIWEDFKTHFEEIHPSFFKKLKEKHASLSLNELKHCTYIVSHLKTKDVAKLINVSPRSVETVRYRIKKKIGLKKDENLIDFLQAV